MKGNSFEAAGLSAIALTPQRYDAVALELRGKSRAEALVVRLGVEPRKLERKRILEIGCGFGEHCAALQDMYGAEVIGIDPWPRFKEGPYKDRAFFRQEDITAASVVHLGRFDIITSYDVFEHVEDVQSAITNLAKLLRPGGRAFLKYNLYRGASASHLLPVLKFPWVHLLHSPKEISEMMFEKMGVAQKPAWVNKWTFANYLYEFSRVGLQIKKEWYVWTRMTPDFYARHREKLLAYPRYELDRDFMCVVLAGSAE